MLSVDLSREILAPGESVVKFLLTSLRQEFPPQGFDMIWKQICRFNLCIALKYFVLDKYVVGVKLCLK